MTIKTGAALSIDIQIRNECRIIIQDGCDRIDVASELTQVQLKQMQVKLRKDLEEFYNALQAVKQYNIRHVIMCMLKLQRRGRLILNEIFKEEAEKLVGAVNMCDRACGSWRYPELNVNPALVSVRTTLGFGIPFEMLPLLELETPDEYKGDLHRVAASFLAFSSIVKRNIGTAPPKTVRLLATPRLPVKSFLYRGLPGVDRANKFLRDNELIDLDSDWPDKKTPKGLDFAEDLATHLWEPGKSFIGHDRRPPAQIYFFACHCDTQKAYHGDYTLEFHTGEAWPKNGKRIVDLDTLTDALDKLRRNYSGDRRMRPLIFLSACGSATVDPAGAGSFPDLFLKRNLGFFGFIGTQATIPDAFAAAFAQAFYEYLLDGWDIGCALHASRWKLLSEQGNPLGILYSLYAEPEIRIQRIEALPATEETLA